MLGDRRPLETPRWTVLASTLLFTLAAGVVVSSAPAAGQSADPAAATENTMLLGIVAAMILLALLEMVVVARASSDWLSVPSFSASLPSLPSFSGSDSPPHERLDGREQTETVESAESSPEDTGQPTLTAIQQVADDRAALLREAGYESVEDVAAADVSGLTDVEGIGSSRAATIAKSANRLLDSPPDRSNNRRSDGPPNDEEESPVLTEQFSPTADSDHTEEAVEKEEVGGLASARAAVAEVVRRACGHTRMLFDRRTLDPCAYGATDDWTALTFDCSDLDDSEPVQELLEETVYIGEVPVEITGEATDRPEWRLSAESSVRVPREGIEQVEQAAQADNPEAKRTVTLLRRALRAEEEQAIRGSSG